MTFGTELCTEIDIRIYKNFKNVVKLSQKYEKVPVFQVLCLKGNILRRFWKNLCGHASACPYVLEALKIDYVTHL